MKESVHSSPIVRLTVRYRCKKPNQYTMNALLIIFSFLIVVTISEANELNPESRLKVIGKSLVEDTRFLDAIIDAVPRLETDADEMVRLDRVKDKDLSDEIDLTMAIELDKTLPKGAALDRRLIANQFRSMFGAPCEEVVDKLGIDHARILQKRSFSGDLESARWFLKVDICSKLIINHESITDRVCESLFCTDATLIKLKQLTQTSHQAYKSILDELRLLNSNLMNLMGVGRQSMTQTR